jgi:hypothetical protein
MQLDSVGDLPTTYQSEVEIAKKAGPVLAYLEKNKQLDLAEMLGLPASVNRVKGVIVRTLYCPSGVVSKSSQLERAHRLRSDEQVIIHFHSADDDCSRLVDCSPYGTQYDDFLNQTDQNHEECRSYPKLEQHPNAHVVQVPTPGFAE